jgi:hypothetical protein
MLLTVKSPLVQHCKKSNLWVTAAYSTADWVGLPNKDWYIREQVYGLSIPISDLTIKYTTLHKFHLLHTEIATSEDEAKLQALIRRTEALNKVLHDDNLLMVGFCDTSIQMTQDGYLSYLGVGFILTSRPPVKELQCYAYKRITDQLYILCQEGFESDEIILYIKKKYKIL